MKRFFFFLSLLLPAAPAAYAQGGPLEGHDSRQPLTIEADRLDVHQQEQQAIFSGHVVVVQGGVTMKADRMRVYYKAGGEDKHSAAAASNAGMGRSISRIDAQGSVLLYTADETAQGEEGVYLVPEETIYLNRKVVLTKGSNVLKGDRMVYNMKTGQSRMMSAHEQGDTGRVRALFVPGEAEKK